MDVVESRDPHGATLPAAVSSGAGAHGWPPPRRGPAQTRSSAGQPEQANSLGVGRKSPRESVDRRRELAFESARLGSREHRRDRLVGALQELVDDLDLLDPGLRQASAYTSTLQPVLLIDHVAGLAFAELVRLVVERRARARRQRERVEPAVEEDAVVLEGERALGPDIRQRPRSAARADDAQYASTNPRCAPAPRR